MLRRLTGAVIVAWVVGLVCAATAAALAKPPASGACHGRTCIFQVTKPGTPGHQNPGSGQRSGNGSVKQVSNPSTPASTCKPTQSKSDDGTAGGTSCAPKVPTNPKALCSYLGGYWTTRALGYIDHCTYPPGGPKTPTTAKGATAPMYTPGQAAMAAVSQLQVYEPKIGSAPCTKANCKGTVGVPVWLWTQPWETQTATATLGPYTVTATAKISKIDWQLGDGTSVTCATAGTAYDVSMGWATSPDCGVPHGFQRVGTYAIKAVATWQVSWTGAATGAQTLTASTTAPSVHVGEYQALTS